MDELDNNKLKAEDDEREVESEENQRGEEIEVNEDRLPSRAMAIHEHIRQEGEKEMERDALALLWSAIAAGLSMGASLLAKGILLENLGYTFGFIIVIMARQQLFTENTVTAVLPVMHNPTLGNVGLLMRLWSVVLAGNLIGTAVAAWAFNYMPIFDEPTRGIDVGAKYEIYSIIAELAKQGKSIVMISSELPELIGMSDRILVLAEGWITGELQKKEFDQNSIMRLASTVKEA